MFYLVNILMIIGLSIFFAGIGKLPMYLFTHKKISYTTAFRILWLSMFFYYTTITIGITILLLHIAMWLGIVVGIITFIGMFLDPNRPISRDVKHSLELARERRD